MAPFLKHLISVCVLLLLAGDVSIGAVPPGFLQGHLQIISPKEVELADGKQPVVEAEKYAEYPLIIRSQHRGEEIARVIADEHGNYRVALPPGNYLLDVQGRARGHLRAKQQRFKVVSNETVHVDMDIDTGVR